MSQKFEQIIDEQGVRDQPVPSPRKMTTSSNRPSLSGAQRPNISAITNGNSNFVSLCYNI
jgi:hypothetical protein